MIKRTDRAVDAIPANKSHELWRKRTSSSIPARHACTSARHAACAVNAAHTANGCTHTMMIKNRDNKGKRDTDVWCS